MSDKKESYHNTVPESGITLEAYRRRANEQDAAVLSVFRVSPTRLFTPFEIWLSFSRKWPLTSIRRAITNLQRAGKLEKTEFKKDGGYGRLNNCWRLKQ